jgi:sortase A
VSEGAGAAEGQRRELQSSPNFMRTRIFNIKRWEMALLAIGIGLVGYAAFAYLTGRISSSAALATFHTQAGAHQPGSGNVKAATSVDYSLWSEKRIKDYEASLAEHFDPPLAVLRIQKIHLEVPLFNGTDDPVLNRGVGRIIGTAQVGQTGNLGIAGHRDGFFRGLKDVVLGDAVELDTTSGSQTYIIDSIKLVTPNDVSVLRNEPTSALTLVTCYPFYFIGSAPQRYIVHASLRGEAKTRNEPAKASLQATDSRTKERTQ